jgi:hypothetical protein
MIDLNKFISQSDFNMYTNEELIEVVQNFEKMLCLGCVIDKTVIVAADIAKNELNSRNTVA